MEDTALTIASIVVGLLTIALLVKVLFYVHHQADRVKELEMQMKAMEKMEEMQVKTEEENNG